MSDYEIKLSVRNLVEFVLRGGDLDTRFMGTSRALEGTRIHQKLQKKYKDLNEKSNLEYKPEVSLVYKFKHWDFDFILEGRADGIIVPKENLEECDEELIIIDEIKSTTQDLNQIDLDYNELHWAQAKCYAFIYAIENDVEKLIVQLTYYQLDTDEVKYLKKQYTQLELQNFFYDLIEKYYMWADYTKSWNEKRDESIKVLKFPFKEYRKGQRELAVAVYKTIIEGKKIFAQAPTGIGKTISTLFPAVKAMGEGNISKIFYLTAKTITRQVAEETFLKMRQGEKYFRFKTISLTAKDKICFNKGLACNPEQCNFAKGHFDRVNDAIIDILYNEDNLLRDKIEQYAKKHEVCPFEFSLDLTLWADCIICDYNYVFDPRVNLKRFFMEGGGDYAFLVDEAHNLVDRAREMYSAELNKRTVLDLKKLMKTDEPKISKALGKINSYMLQLKKELPQSKTLVLKEGPKELYGLIGKFIKDSEEWLAKNEKTEAFDKLLELYFDCLAFIRISELYDERYVTYVQEEDNNLIIKLFCLDPSFLLKEAAKKGKSSIYFSATLNPMNYYKEILGGEDSDYILRLQSPFDRNNLTLLIGENISTKYKNRNKSYDEIVEYIYIATNKKRGNYLVFFPSYKYMNEVYNRFLEQHPEVDARIQANNMDEEQREQFLNEFQSDNKETMVVFVVLGGIFSEGIDLKGERLIGAIIVGVGLPQICLERDIIKDYFNNKNKLGYEYSYMFPGMNKVQQAAGRVIRSETDRGVVLLLDERFSSSTYQSIFPKEWAENIKVKTGEQVFAALERFWNKK